MQPRLSPRSRNNTTFTRTIIKLLLVIVVLFFGFFFVEKIDFPSPKKEIIEDVTNKISKIK